MENEEYEVKVIDTEGEAPSDAEPSLVLGDDDPRDAGLHERIISREQAWKGRFLDVRSARVELPNGRVTGRDLVRHPGASAVVALTESGKIVLVRQYRTAIDRVTVESPPASSIPARTRWSAQSASSTRRRGSRPAGSSTSPPSPRHPGCRRGDPHLHGHGAHL